MRIYSRLNFISRVTIFHFLPLTGHRLVGETDPFIPHLPIRS